MDVAFVDAATVERAFYEAFARLDLRRMSEVWAEGAETVCIHPGGPLLQGKAAILDSWREILSGSAPPTLRHRAVQRFATGALAVHLVEETITTAGTAVPQTTRVLATNVYAYLGDSWRMLEHHASLPLGTRRAPEPNAPARVH